MGAETTVPHLAARPPTTEQTPKMPTCTEAKKHHEVWVSGEPQPGGTSMRLTTSMRLKPEDLPGVMGMLRPIDPVGRPQMKISCSVESDLLVVTVENVAREEDQASWELVIRWFDDRPDPEKS